MSSPFASCGPTLSDIRSTSTKESSKRDTFQLIDTVDAAWPTFLSGSAYAVRPYYLAESKGAGIRCQHRHQLSDMGLDRLTMVSRKRSVPPCCGSRAGRGLPVPRDGIRRLALALESSCGRPVFSASLSRSSPPHRCRGLRRRRWISRHQGNRHCAVGRCGVSRGRDTGDCRGSLQPVLRTWGKGRRPRTNVAPTSR